ncbi:MAG TPA: gas vesicle protein GvpG [Streptosporangiaceae bacterium]|nr:gas vesicle protein GvpG [Streptosporangiaceae bacterium]
MFSALVRLPFLPVVAVVRLAEIIADEAEREVSDPAIVRRRLEEAEQARAAGLITDDEFARAERQAAGAALRGARSL